MILLRIEVKQIVIDLNSVPDEFDGIAVAEVVVVNVERSTAFGNGTACMLRNRDCAVANVMVDLDVFVDSARVVPSHACNFPPAFTHLQLR